MPKKHTHTLVPADRSMWLSNDVPQPPSPAQSQLTIREERVIQHSRAQGQAIEQTGTKGRFANHLLGIGVDEAQTIYVHATERMFRRAQAAVEHSPLGTGFSEDFEYAMRKGARDFCEVLRDGLVDNIQTAHGQMKRILAEDTRPADQPLNPFERWWYGQARNDWGVR